MLAAVFDDSDPQVIERGQLAHDFLSETLRDLYAIMDRERGVHCDIGFAMQAMPQPARTKTEDAPHARDLLAGRAHRSHDLRFDPVNQPDKYRGSGLPDDPQNRRGDRKTNHRIGPRVAQL